MLLFKTSHKIDEKDGEEFDFEIQSQDYEMAIVVRKFLNIYRKRGRFKNR